MSKRGKGEVAVINFVEGLNQLVAGLPERCFDLAVRYARPPCNIDRPVEQMIGIGHAADGYVVRYRAERAGDDPVRVQ